MTEQSAERRQIERAFGRSDTAAMLDGDRLFHASLVAATGSPRLRRINGQLQQEQHLALALAERSSRELGRTADDHRRLLDALHGSPEKSQSRTHRTSASRRRRAATAARSARPEQATHPCQRLGDISWLTTAPTAAGI